jgi:hypothetical protein
MTAPAPVPDREHELSGTGPLAEPSTSAVRGGASLVRSQTYEITFTGQAGATLRAEFDDCDITVGQGMTTLRAELPDEAALAGLIQRITSLRLEVIDVHLVAPPPPGQ